MHLEFLEKLSGLIITAFGLVAALAWNDAIKSLFTPGGLLESAAAYGVWVYALFVTIIAVAVTVYMSRLETKAKELKDERKNGKARKG